jgi:hypothetical protein
MYYFFYKRGGKAFIRDISPFNILEQEICLRLGFLPVPNDDSVFRVRMSFERFEEIYRGKFSNENMF